MIVMARRTHSMGCPYCEGTGKELNHFDPPVVEYRKPMTSFFPLKERTKSGREILDEPCPACNGTLMITVIVEMDPNPPL
ncbi:hypothetical protein BW425_08015 [Bacillus pseudomycoides]|uniref:Uncharacterized protein n=2 Tax=Bacillaceae TaxID=186817 RepID=A0A1Y3MKC7_9BACI|nr:hypothetical protein BW425_08015 [Bacillus pseudomycoides]